MAPGSVSERSAVVASSADNNNNNNSNSIATVDARKCALNSANCKTDTSWTSGNYPIASSILADSTRADSGRQSVSSNVCAATVGATNLAHVNSDKCAQIKTRTRTSSSSNRELQEADEREAPKENDCSRDKPKVTGDHQSARIGKTETSIGSPLSLQQSVKSAKSKLASSSKSQLGAVRSLENSKATARKLSSSKRQTIPKVSSTSTSSSSSSSAASSASTATATTTSGALQKPMFSLKQLAINSRNLAKKGSYLVQGTTSETQVSQQQAIIKQQTKHLEESQNSSNSSGEHSLGTEQFVDCERPIRDQNDTTCSEEYYYGSIMDGAVRGAEVRADSDLDDIRNEAEREDDNEEEGEKDGEDYEDDDDDDYDDDEDEGDYEQHRRENESDREGNSRRKKKTQASRPNKCDCEPIVSMLNENGQLITDVDLITFKDLCQMEQHAHNLRQHSRRSNHLDPHLESTKSFMCNLHSGSLRRSSLQEESGAYYQLCMSNEEQLMRQKYLWFPPSLKKLSLVNQFFANFPKDKIPYASSSGAGGSSKTVLQKQSAATNNESNSNSSCNTNVGQVCSSFAATSNPNPHSTIKASPDCPAAGAGSTDQQLSTAASGGANSQLAISYRDEQISFQLPRQDISLDYCSYRMSDSSRAAYTQFKEKRNSTALDVGNVVQIKLTFQSAQFNQQQQPQPHSTSGSQTQATQSQRQLRKASLVNQSTSGLQTLREQTNPGGQLEEHSQEQQQQQQQQPVSKHNAGSHTTNQRCRRCLVRFDDGQLAVVAPNFVIGSTLYRNSIITNSPAEISLFGRRKPNSAIGCQQQAEQLDSTPGLRQQPSSTIGSPKDPTSHGLVQTNSALFHPTCFTCAVCKEFLVDLVYCLRENKIYCVRHYGDSLRPRCSWCQELIFSDEYLKAMNESFHVDHFLCRRCDSNLAGQRYVLKEEKPYCVQCYESNFANTCEDCQKPIGIDSRDLSYKERHWHDTCFLCQKCQQSLIDKPFGSKADKVYCADCYDVAFATRCDECKNPFRAGSKKMEYRGRQWHDSCFCCCICKNTIGSNSFIPKNEEIYCIKCYEDKYATRCTKCKQVIVTGGVTFRNEPWHRDCFNCCNCNKSLAGQRFTTRDVAEETVKNTNKTKQPHNAYCIDCYGELFAKRCYACSQAIIGLGGTRFVTFEERSWHNDCFVCNDCNSSLVGKGFITDGPESILCGDCARAKLR